MGKPLGSTDPILPQQPDFDDLRQDRYWPILLLTLPGP
jgi:hypothetical protein